MEEGTGGHRSVAGDGALSIYAAKAGSTKAKSNASRAKSHSRHVV